MYHRKKTYGFGKYTWQQITAMVADGYIPIANATELDGIRNTTPKTMGLGTIWEDTYVTGLDKKYVQVNNIDLVSYQAGTGWEAIGSLAIAFTGVYDGNYLKISNCVINNPTVNYQGVFGYISAAKVKNLEISDFNISGKDYTGVIAYVASLSEVTHVTSKDGIVVGAVPTVGGVGGMFGRFDSGTASWLIVVNVNISSPRALNTSNIGGMGGFIATTNSVFSFCVVKNSTISKPNGPNAQDTRVGGFAGVTSSKFNNCYVFNTSVYAVGGASGYSGLGGFVGRTINGSPTFVNCYSNASVIAGGINIPRGGFCGRLTVGSITNSYYDTDISGQTDTGKGLPRTTAQMKQGTADSTIGGEAMYTAWDDAIWNFRTNLKYPKIRKL